MTKYLPWIVGFAVLLVLVIMVTGVLQKRSKIQKDKKKRALDLLREQALDKALINDAASTDNMGIVQSRPVEVSYGLDDKERLRERSKVMGSNIPKETVIEITDISELSQRKYVLGTEKPIRIGGKVGLNQVVIASDEIEETQCEIVKYEEEIFVTNIGKKDIVLLIRGDKPEKISRGLTPIKTGDFIKILDSLLKIEVVTVGA